MDDVYVYLVPLPPAVKEMVAPCIDGFTVYINDKLDNAARIEAYNHALEHIRRDDWRKVNVQSIEAAAHRQTATDSPQAQIKVKPKKKTLSRTEAYMRRMAKREAVLAKHGLYEEVEFVDGENGELIAKRIIKYAKS